MNNVMLGTIILTTGVVLISACGNSKHGENHLSYNGEALPVKQVKCLSSLKQLIAEFDGGTLKAFTKQFNSRLPRYSAF